jgi:DNA-binding NarL/FixJ family response regulator
MGKRQLGKKRGRSAQRLRILLADDHELVRRGIRGLLHAKRKWLVVGEARDGVEAIARAKELKPHVVILDIDMPHLNGLEAARRIREAVPNTKILMLTLHESGEMLRRALETGAQGFVLKSDLAESLVNALKEISGSKTVLTSKASDIVMREFLRGGDEAEPGAIPEIKPTLRELEVMRLLTEGRTNKEIAATLGISVRTAEMHRANIMKKFGFRSLAELIRYAMAMELTTSKNAAEASAERVEE